MTLDRSEINRALSKAIAFKQCNKHAEARAWAAELVRLLDVADILSAEAVIRWQNLVRGPAPDYGKEPRER